MKTEPRDTLRRFFAGISEQTFQTQLGVADPPLIDYISDLLVRFVRSDAVYKIRSLTGQPLAQVTAMLAEAEERVGEARRDVGKPRPRGSRRSNPPRARWRSRCPALRIGG